MNADCIESYKRICGFSPHEHQEKLWEYLENDDIIGVTLLSGTGSGKTEAPLIPCLMKDKRLILVYPTRSLVDDQIFRITKYIRRMLLHNPAVKKTLIVDIGTKEIAYQYRIFKDELFHLMEEQIRFWADLPNFKGVEIREKDTKMIEIDINNAMKIIRNKLNTKSKFEMLFSPGCKSIVEIHDIEEDAKFFILQTKKHYYGGDIILTTLDKFLYRFFGYGEKKWNLLYPFRLLINPKELVIVFDEAHSYESVAYTNFIRLISTLIINPEVKVVVMSATLPNGFIEYVKSRFNFLEVFGGEYKGKKSYEIYDINERKDRNSRIKEIIDSNSHKKIIIVRNTVHDAFQVYNELNPIKGTTDYYEYQTLPVFFYHGRLFDFIKSKIYKQLKQLDDKNMPYILVTTHAIEVGCDLDSDLLITDFCNPDQLIQRFGRCARKKGREGTAYIIGTDFQEYDKFMKEDFIDYQALLKILKENSGKELPEKDIRTLIKHDINTDQITDALFGLLYSYIYDFDRAYEELHKSGMLVTRSWAPSANMILLNEQADIKKIKKIVSDREMNLNELINWLDEQKWIYNTSPIQIGLEYLSNQNEVDLNKINNNIFVVGVENSFDTDEEKGYVGGTISPYLNEIYVFYKAIEYPNHNPYGFGLISPPKAFKIEKKDLKRTISIKKQILPEYYKNWSGDVKIEYLDLTQPDQQS